MKKYLSLFLVCVLVLSGCEKNNAAEELPAEYADYFEYPVTQNESTLFSQRFAVDENGGVYLCSHIMENTVYGQEVSGSAMTGYDMNGNISGEYLIGKTVTEFDVKNGMLYGVFLNAQGGELSAVDLQTGSTSNICNIPEIMSALKCEVTGNYAYILGKFADRTGIEGEFSDISGMYGYDCEKLIRVDISSGDIEESKVKFPISFSVSGDKCEVYAADRDGYYFCGFDGSGRCPHDIQAMDGFAMISKDRFVFSANSGNDMRKLCAGSLNNADGMSQVYDDVFISGNTIRSFGGYTYFYAQRFSGNDMTEGVIRLYNNSYIRKNNKIKFISAQYDFDVPFGCGYTMDYRNLSDDEFALAVLSQSSDYDICIVNSYQSYASNIRDKGSFYPLNDVPGVREYLDRCFPCIREAAVNDDGEIWMLPVSVNVPLIIYNKAACEKAGISLSDDMSLSGFISACETAFKNGSVNGISAHPYPLIQNLLMQYLSVYNDLDTGLFRDTAKIIKEKINISEPGKFPEYLPAVNIALNSIGLGGSYDDVLFAAEYDIQPAIYEAVTGVFNAVPLPDITGNGNTATCAFLTVNPASEDIGTALDYISSLCGYLMNTENSFLLSDRSTYTDTECMSDIFGIYKNSHVCFNISEEIIYSDLVRYMSGEITLDELINEGNRKLKTYLGE